MLSETRGRDRERTEATILGAARDQLAEAGFQAFGVNAVARRAGCDKQLIYRYFGGLEGLTAAVGRDLADPLDEPTAALLPPRSYGELSERLMLGFLERFRSDRLAQQIAAWELSERSPLVDALANARAEALHQWMERMRGSLNPPPGIDAPALNALLIGGIQQLVLASNTMGSFAGLPLSEDRNWIRARLAIRALIRGIYRPLQGGPDTLPEA
jgi:AcrR family transcriptional regulator